MAQAIPNPATQRYALVTGANKGIGLEICRQLASKGIMVLSTDKNDKIRGTEADQDNVVFHRLDVLDPVSIAATVELIKARFGRLDILVNNAGVSGIELEGDVSILQEIIERDVASVFADAELEPVELKARGSVIETYKGAEECVHTNYYGAKRVTEAMIPLLQLSASPRIVNVSSLLGNLKLLSNEWAKQVLSNEEILTEDRIDEVVQEFLRNFKEDSLESEHWPAQLRSYKVSKAALNAYTRCVAKKNPSFCVNSVCPGLARTDLTWNLGMLSAAEAAESPVRLALLPDGGPSGFFFYWKELSEF